MNCSLQYKVLSESNKNLDSGIYFFLSIVLYRLLLDYIYIHSIAPVYSYQRLSINYAPHMLGISWAILCVYTLLVIPFLKMQGEVIPKAMLMLFVLRYVPFTSFIACQAQTYAYIGLVSLFWLLIILMFRYLPSPRMFFIRKKKYLIDLVTLALVLSVVWISGYYAHFRITFDVFNVYDLRLEARQFEIPLLVKYLWLSSAYVLPLLMVYYINRNKKGVAAILAIVVLLNFSINGLKSILFILFLCLAFCFFVKKDITPKLGWLLCGLCVLAVIFDYSSPSDIGFISNFIIRRICFVPTLLDTLYYDYVSQHGPIFFHPGEGDSHVFFVIGKDYFDKAAMSANNGLFSDAFINLGIWGCMIYPLVYAFFFKCCEAAFIGLDNQIVFFVTFLMVFCFNSTAFTTALFSHGVVLMCFVLYLMPREMMEKR